MASYSLKSLLSICNAIQYRFMETRHVSMYPVPYPEADESSLLMPDSLAPTEHVWIFCYLSIGQKARRNQRDAQNADTLGTTSTQVTLCIP